MECARLGRSNYRESSRRKRASFAPKEHCCARGRAHSETRPRDFQTGSKRAHFTFCVISLTPRFSPAVGESKLPKPFQPDFRSGGARPPRALFPAPSRKTPGAQKNSEDSCQCRAQGADREARPATPGAGVLPFYFGVRDQRLLQCSVMAVRETVETVSVRHRSQHPAEAGR